MRLLSLALVLSTGLALAEPLADARAQVTALDFKAARKSLQAAEGQPGLSRAQVLELYELSGIVAGTLNEPKVARDAFTRLLNLEPALKLSGKYAPRVTTPFLEAKGWVAEKGALALEVTPPELGSTLRPLQVKLAGDVFSRVRVLRVAVREDAGAWRVVEGPGPSLEVPVHGAHVAFHVEALDPQGWQLAARGTEAEPLTVEAPVVAVVAPPKDAPVVEPLRPAPPVSAAATAEVRSAHLQGRVVGGLALGVGIISLVSGALFLVGAWTQWLTYQGAIGTADPVTGITRAQALVDDARYQQTVVLGGLVAGLGVALCVTGGVLLGTSGEPAKAHAMLLPLPGGGLVTLAGSLP